MTVYPSPLIRTTSLVLLYLPDSATRSWRTRIRAVVATLLEAQGLSIELVVAALSFAATSMGLLPCRV